MDFVMHVFIYNLEKTSTTVSVICFSHCMASNPSITQYPPGVQLPHEPGPSNGQLPPGEGCYNCNYDFGEVPLSKPYNYRRKRSVAESLEVGVCLQIQCFGCLFPSFLSSSLLLFLSSSSNSFPEEGFKFFF